MYAKTGVNMRCNECVASKGYRQTTGEARLRYRVRSRGAAAGCDRGCGRPCADSVSWCDVEAGPFVVVLQCARLDAVPELLKLYPRRI